MKPSSQSREVFKSILKNGAITNFQGKIYVDSIAQKTDGYQMSRSLLLDNESKANNKPELEIYADDVKCSHGCTIGQLDENALFYLRTRGVSKEDANAILTFAFASEAMDKISIPVLGDHVKSLMEDKLGVNLSI